METVVYTALVALLSVLVVQSILAMSKTFKSVRVSRDLENSALVALDRITREIRLSDSVAPGGIFGTNTSKLMLAYSSSPAITREFSVTTDKTLNLIENGIDSGPLTSTNVSVTVFRVDQATTSSKTAFRVTLTLQDKRDTVSPKSATFYTAAAMRNLY